MKLCPRKVDKALVLYGYGNLGHLAEEVFKELKIPISVIMDKNDLTYELLDPYWKFLKSSLVAVCVASEPYQPIDGQLREFGFTDIIPVYDIIEAYPQVEIHNGWFTGELSAEDHKEIGVVCFHLDALSCKHYINFMWWHEQRRELSEPLEPRPPLPSTLADIRDRQSHFSIWMDYKKPIEFASIHAEGHELGTLQDNMPVFKKYRTELEVACYHSRDGLWKIPKYLMDNLDNYTFKFRLHAYMGQGAFIYCTPKEMV